MTCFNDILDKLSVKENKLISSFIFLLFKNVATRKHKLLHLASVMFLLDGAALDSAVSDGE